MFLNSIKKLHLDDRFRKLPQNKRFSSRTFPEMATPAMESEAMTNSIHTSVRILC